MAAIGEINYFGVQVDLKDVNVCGSDPWVIGGKIGSDVAGFGADLFPYYGFCLPKFSNGSGGIII